MWPVVDTGEITTRFGAPGYRDALCGFIGHRLTGTVESRESGLVVRFAPGALAIGPAPADLTGPEIATRQVRGGGRVYRPGEAVFAWLGQTPRSGYASGMDLRQDAHAMSDDLVALRRALHQVPELGLDLPRTQETVLQALDGLPLEISTGTGLSSVTAVLRGQGGDGDVVLLRGDMDALPVTENTGAAFSSRHEGRMHACGHDLHTAGLVGAARLLSAHRDRLAGDVVFMFQPGEEGHDGAGHMIAEGVLDAAGRPVAEAYGLHVVSAMIPRGRFVSRPGPIMAAADGLFVRVLGAGGHGSRPHVALDPVPAACEMVTALQTMVTRRFSVFDPVVVTVGTFHAGTQRNIIPPEARFEATIRSFSKEARERVAELAVPLCRDIAAAHGLEAEVTYSPEYPVTVNDPAGHEFVAETVREVFGEERFTEAPDPVTGSEDFSRVLDRVPGAFVFLGATFADDPDSAPYNHSPEASFDDSVVADGAALLASLAARRLSGARA